jgi:hypothetical protein
LLAEGANFFCPDDHDLWGDYTLGKGAEPENRDRDRFARDLFRAFQGGEGLQTFSVGRLRVALVDARLSRTDLDANPAGFMTDDDLERLVSFLQDEGDGPCVLVVGQPLFGERWYRHCFGTDIPQYDRQFRTLSQAMLSCGSSVLVLTGDLHFGRVSYGVKPNGKRLIELISSPLSLPPLRRLAGVARPWRRALRWFPSADAPGACRIETDCSYRLTTSHFVTLDFQQGSSAGAVDVECRSWPTSGSSIAPGTVIYRAQV